MNGLLLSSIHSKASLRGDLFHLARTENIVLMINIHPWQWETIHLKLLKYLFVSTAVFLKYSFLISLHNTLPHIITDVGNFNVPLRQPRRNVSYFLLALLVSAFTSNPTTALNCIGCHCYAIQFVCSLIYFNLFPCISISFSWTRKKIVSFFLEKYIYCIFYFLEIKKIHITKCDYKFMSFTVNRISYKSFCKSITPQRT